MPEDMKVAPYNVVAAYVERDAALAARERLLQEGVDEGSISIDGRSDALMVADAEMRQEADGLVGGPGLVATESQSKGAGAGFLIAGAIGAAVGLAIGAIVFGSTFGVIVCAIVGAVAGAIFGGDRRRIRSKSHEREPASLASGLQRCVRRAFRQRRQCRSGRGDTEDHSAEPDRTLQPG